MFSVRGMYAVPLGLLLQAVVWGCDGGVSVELGEQQDHMIEVAPAVADAWVAAVRPEQNDWSWGDGVLMYGLSEVARTRPGTRYWEYLERWADSHIARGYYVAFSDNCPPAIAAVRLYGHTGEPRYLEVAEKTLHYLDAVAARTSDGGLNHMGWITKDQLWVDSLFMFGIFLVEMEALSGQERLLDVVCEQIEIFARHLRDADTGFFVHMWDDGDRTRVPADPVYWARGNAWVFVTLVELLARLPQGHRDRAAVESMLRTMADSLARTQDETGLWHTVLEVPETYLETSAAALFCYGFAKAIRLGLLDSSFIAVKERAQRGLASRLLVDCSGSLEVTGTSHGTSPGSLEAYAKVTVGDQVPYGVGAMMLAGVETGMAVPAGLIRRAEDCGPVPGPLPLDPEGLIQAAIRALAGADLEGAKAYFHRAAQLDGSSVGVGAALCGEALVDVIFLGLDLFDTITRYSIADISRQELEEHIRGAVLVELARIEDRLRMAAEAPRFVLAVPEIDINRRGLYTPVRDLRIGSETIPSLNALLGIIETVLRVLF